MKQFRRMLALLMLAATLFTSLPVSALAADDKNGWIKENGSYYLYEDNEKLTGWQQTNGNWHYLDTSTGAMQTGWITVDNEKYYLSQTYGVMLTGVQTINGCVYYFGSDGAMQTGWLQRNGRTYYLGSNGVMQTGWTRINGDWYYFDDPYGAMYTGWLELGSEKYYMNSDGVMQTGTQTISGIDYYFNSDGTYDHRVTAYSSGGSSGGSPSYSGSTQSYTVYVSRTGKIHTNPHCSGMKYYTTMTYAQAKAAGYVECKNCY